MKTKEAPEKIWVHELSAKELNVPLKEYHVEYTRTDTFIEKALKWYCLDCICNDTCSNTCYFKSTFRKYLEGDDKQLPPKIENAINPDGSTTENYRYRHFISRMQDAFIEKACEWIKTNMDDYIYVEYDTVTGKPTNEAHIAHKRVVEDFKKYMKGE